MFVDVLIPPLDYPLSYAVPKHLEHLVNIGTRLSVPLRNRYVSGFIKAINTTPPPGVVPKELSKIIGAEPVLIQEQYPFFEKLAKYYVVPLSEVLDVAVPPVAAVKNDLLVALHPEVERHTASDKVKGIVQKRIITFLASKEDFVFEEEIAKDLGKSGKLTATLKKLEDKKIIITKKLDQIESFGHDIVIPDWAKKEVDLSQEQKSAVTEINASKDFQTFLLHGPTGSGKTEVYLHAVDAAIKKGFGAIIMVPEIALTSQIVHRFQAQFGSDVVVLHSSLQKRTRWDGWRSLATGRAKIAIGARSAIFAPVHNLGIIILDEEHDSSYKGHESFRYHAKDVALIRAKVAKCSVVLGSATPSLETMYGVKQKKITYVPLPKRKLSDTHKNLVHVVDMLLAKKEAKKSDNISLKLFNAIQEAISRNEQSFVLFNRRGFATYLQCDECGDPLYCKHCDVTMTFHQKRNLVACHYCGAQFSPPKQCFTCINERSKDPTAKIGDYVLRGAGTEKVFEELQTLFPKNKVVRLDRDVADNAEEYEKILDDVRGQKIDIVVGTQIIAKGHDLPGVTVVGVVDCDVALHLPDFRAGERMAQLLIQVAGRAGRHKEHGQVFLQTRVPLHPAVLAALHDNYNAFARSEMEARLSAWYPPYAKLLRIVVQSKDNELASKVLGVLLGTAIDFVTFVEKEGKGRMEVLGPVQASIAKIKDEWRWHGIVKAEEAVVLSELVRVLKGRKHQGVGGKVRVNYDLDPVDMM